MRNRESWIVLVTLALGSSLGTTVGSGDEPPASRGTGAKVVVEQDTFDLGKIKQGVEVSATFVIGNEGDGNLEIHSIKPDCGCTIATLSQAQRLVPPGGNVPLVVTFKSKGRFGIQDRIIQVSTNDRNHPIVKLNLKCNVVTTYVIRPSPSVTFRNGRRGKEITQRLKLLPGDDHKRLELLEIVIADPGIHCNAEPLIEGDRYGHLLRFVVDDDAPIGDIVTQGTLQFRVDQEQEEVAITIRGSVVGDLAYRPGQLISLKQTPRGTALPPWTVGSTEKKPFSVIDADAGPLLTAEVTPRNAQKTEYRVVLTVADDAPSGPLATVLRVTTDTSEQPLIEVPVFVNIAQAVDVDPLLVRLINGESDHQRQRRVRLQTNAARHPALEIEAAECDLPFVTIRILPVIDLRFPNRRIVVAELAGDAPPGDYRGRLTLRTNVAGAETINLPLEVRMTTGGIDDGDSLPDQHPGGSGHE